MKILVTGATGFVGSHLLKKLLPEHQITVLTRNIEKAQKEFADKVDYLSDLNGLSELNDYDAVINLAGEPIVAKRWSPVQKDKICKSRWDITQQISSLIQASETPPNCLISASAIGFYGARDKERLDEASAGREEFSHQVCKHWESHALSAQSNLTRVCVTRIGIVLGDNGGALAKMLPPFKLGLGGPIGHGEQGMSWIHIDDLTELMLYLLQNPQCQGIFNATAPNPVSNKDFATALGKAIQRPAFIPTPAIALKLAMGEMSELLTEGQFVYPGRTLLSGFQFRFPYIQDALDNLFAKPELCHN